MLLQELNQLAGFRSLGEVQSQVTGVLLQRVSLGQIAQAGDADITAHLLQHLVVTFRPYLIKYNSSHTDIRSEAHKPRQKGRHGVCCRTGIDHQHDGDVQHACYLCRGTLVAVVAVEESHHALHHADVSIGSVVAEELTDVTGCSHEGVEVDTGTSAYCLVKLGIDIVRSTLKGLYLVSLLHQQCHEPSGNGCLARATRRGCYQK